LSEAWDWERRARHEEVGELKYSKLGLQPATGRRMDGLEFLAEFGKKKK